MSSPLDAMIDAAVRCLKCGKGMKDCRCWITLACHLCGSQKLVERHPIDPPQAAAVRAPCLRCRPDGRITVTYFDANGNEIPL